MLQVRKNQNQENSEEKTKNVKGGMPPFYNWRSEVLLMSRKLSVLGAETKKQILIQHGDSKT